jgi:hypothetical protein
VDRVAADDRLLANVDDLRRVEVALIDGVGRRAIGAAGEGDQAAQQSAE